jgi:predicted Co/Zn/Cd cation transporter (cation efflux family)
VTSALLVAFGAAIWLGGTDTAWLIPYADPAVLALLSLVLLPLPLREARESFAEILMNSPPELDARVRGVMANFVARHQFLDFRSYVSKAGRAQFIEISVLVPPDLRVPVAEIDAVRVEIGTAIGEARPECWLTIFFTAYPTQL